MKTTEELKQLNIILPPPEQITGYKGVYNRYVKRALDFVFAAVAVVLLSPLMLLTAASVALCSGFPVFYRAERCGYLGKPFRIFKFRTMVKNADKIGGGTTALNDPRITRVGRFLRKTKMDELANLFNIIRGEMSFVGPRPELLRYTKLYSGEEEYILKVRPGITDFSSCTFINLDEIVGSENADEMYEKYVLKNKNALRVKYAAEVSFKTDVKIFFKTLFGVVQKFFFAVSGKN